MFVAQALDRPYVEPTAVGPEEAARMLLTHGCWSLVSWDVKRTKAGRELRLFPCPPNHVVPIAWAEVLGLLGMRMVVRSMARTSAPTLTTLCPAPATWGPLGKHPQKTMLPEVVGVTKLVDWRLPHKHG